MEHSHCSNSASKATRVEHSRTPWEEPGTCKDTCILQPHGQQPR